MISNFPKVLVICESPFSLDNGFGVTLSNLFLGWPSDCLGLFYFSKAYKASHRKVAVQSHAHVPASPSRRHALPMLLGIRPEWRGCYSHAWLHTKLKGFKPDLVYSFICSESSMYFGGWIANRLSIPHVIHVGDDGLTMASCTTKYIQESSHCIAISDEMALEYQNRYGKYFNVIRNGASPEYFPIAIDTQNAHKKDLTICYLGRIYSWLHYDSLRLLGSAVELCQLQGVRWKVKLYGTVDEKDLCSSGILTANVSYEGQVGEAEGVALLRAADLLVVPLTYNDAELENYKLSFPTKLSQFLATGKPVLLLSSPTAASAKFCMRHNVGKLIGTPSLDEIIAYLKLLWYNPALGHRQGLHNIQICRELLDLEKIRYNFQKLLVEL
jgi:glycosyltransferase involved in cell wall biosynthesis